DEDDVEEEEEYEEEDLSEFDEDDVEEEEEEYEEEEEEDLSAFDEEDDPEDEDEEEEEDLSEFDEEDEPDEDEDRNYFDDMKKPHPEESPYLDEPYPFSGDTPNKPSTGSNLPESPHFPSKGNVHSSINQGNLGNIPKPPKRTTAFDDS